MILRIVRGRVPPGGMAALGERVGNAYAATARSTPGLVRFHVAVRPREDGHDVVLVTFWNGVEAALDAFGGDLDSPRVLGGLEALARFTDVRYFEVDETQLRRATGDVAVVRVTVGRVARGVDAAIQAELRARMRALPDDMVEAYVGRRILGDDVEIAFISAWDRVPPGQALDEPIWPDLAARYDAFSVETFVPVGSGAGATA